MSIWSTAEATVLPLHPVLVHFPIALFAVALAADAVGRLWANALANALGFCCLLLAVVGAAGAVVTGSADMLRADLAMATHAFVHLHRDIGLVLLATLVCLAIWRCLEWRRGGGGGQVGWPYLLAASVVFVLLTFQGWFGGQLVYGLGAGVAAAGQGVVSPEEGQLGLAPFAPLTGVVHPHQGHAH